MSNPTGRPLLPPPSQWPQAAPPSLPDANPPWTFPPPPGAPPPGAPPPGAPPPSMVYPNVYPYPPVYSQPAPDAATWQYPGSQDVPPNIPFNAVPSPIPASLVPNFPPPVGLPPPLPAYPGESLSEGVSPPLPVDPRFPPPNPQAIPPSLSCNTSEGSQTDIRLSKDPRKMAKMRRDSLTDETDMSAINEQYINKVQKNTHSMLTSKMNTSQEGKDKEHDFAKQSQLTPHHSKDISSRNSKETKLKKCNEYSPDRFNSENEGSIKTKDKHLSDNSSGSRNKLPPDHKDSKKINDESSRSRSSSRDRSRCKSSPDYNIGSHFRDRSSKSRSPIPSRGSPNHRASSHFRDGPSRSPSHSIGFLNDRANSHVKSRSSRSPSCSSHQAPKAPLHFRERSSRSRNSPPRDYKDSKHGRDQSTRSSRHSVESKHHNDRLYKSSQYTRDDKYSKDHSRDNRSSIKREYEHSKKFRDRSRSRSRLSDKFRDENSLRSDRSRKSMSKDYRGGTSSYPSIKGAMHSRGRLDGKPSHRVSQRQANNSDSDAEYERRGNYKKTKHDSKASRKEISHRSKSSDHSNKKHDLSGPDSMTDKSHIKSKESSSAEEKNQLKKLTPKGKSVDPKLKLYDDIWRKVRGKAKSQMKLGSKKVSVSPKINDKEKEKPKTDLPKDMETVKDSENVTGASPCRSSSKGRGKKDSPKKAPRKPAVREKEGCKSSKTKKLEPLESKKVNYSRSEKRDRSRERLNENEDQPCLSTEPSKSITSTPAEQYYLKVEDTKEVVASDALKELHNKFRYELVERSRRAKACRPKYDPPKRKIKLRKHKPIEAHSDSKSSSSCSSEESSSDDEDTSLEELERKRRHPDRLHPELWFNDPNEMNDGPLCRCSAKARRSGIRHGIYVGEGHLPPCIPESNNANTLYHYKICVTPVTNFLTKNPTFIIHNKTKYIFEGFSMFSHKPLPKLPNCKVIRFNYEYTLMYVEEKMPTNFTVAGLELFSRFLLHEILELVDLDWKAHNDGVGCPQFHFMPRFAKKAEGDTKELLSLNVVMKYLLKANKLLIDEKQLSEMLAYSSNKWQDLADQVKGMIVTCPGMKPSSVRVDQLDREHTESSKDTTFPVIVHFGVRPPQLSYAGNPLYQKAWRDYVKYRHLLANKPKVSYADKHKLTQKEGKLQEMRMENDLKRDVTIVISSKGFYQTGMMSDVIQHAMLLPILVCHLRFHASLTNLEDKIGYKFQDRFLLQLALTHPSYRENFGTNPDHARNSLTNCGLRQPQYGDRRIHYMNTRKRGINTLINIMSRFGNQQESASRIHHNERLEFLGDAVVEFLSSIHLFYMFPDLEEGGLATYRAAIVQNQHLAVLAKKLELETFMLYAHGSDLCHDLELRHAMANCFEALMGALFLDAGIEVADKVFSNTLFPEPELKEVWMNYPLHPLQEQEPNGDRRWIESIPLLQKLNKFEEQIGIEFTHIRLLARALTHRSLGYNNLTLGSNQRLEFLGDTVLQLVASEYLYKFFPQHHEGHLSLLRSSLVNNRTQAVVCGDLGMVEYAIYPYFKVELKPKDKADLLEAFLGALYIDKDLGYCRKFCEVCFFPRLQDFIMNQDWNDPKSKLQQCCLTLRSMDGGEPDIPTYKVIECKGPTNTRVYGVAVYFQGNRLAVGEGHSIQQAEMDAAANALRKSKDLFPQLRHQKRAIERSLKQGPPKSKEKKRSRRKTRSVK